MPASPRRQSDLRAHQQHQEATAFARAAPQYFILHGCAPPGAHRCLTRAFLLVEVMGRYLNRSDQGERIRQVLQIVPSGPSQAVPRTPKRVARRLEASKAAELVQGYLDGVPVDELAERFQVNPSTVQKHVRQKGLPRRSPRLGQAHIEKAIQLYIAGGSLANLGKHFGIGEDTVAPALRRAGLALRPRAGRVEDGSTEQMLAVEEMPMLWPSLRPQEQSSGASPTASSKVVLARAGSYSPRRGTPI